MDTHQYKEIGRPLLVPAKEVQCLLVLLDRGFQGPSFHGGQSHAGGSFHPGTPVPVIRCMTGYHCITPPREQHIVYCSVSLNYLSDRASSLAVLSRMHRVNDEVPVTVHAGYRLTDPYLTFRFVYPQRGRRPRRGRAGRCSPPSGKRSRPIAERHSSNSLSTSFAGESCSQAPRIRDRDSGGGDRSRRPERGLRGCPLLRMQVVCS